LTEKEYEELTSAQKKLGVLKEQIDYYSAYKNLEIKDFDSEHASVAM
jgi:hypothetical protein